MKKWRFRVVKASMKNTTLVVAILLIIALCSCASQKGKQIEKGAIKSDTTWSGEIVVKGDVEVAKGATLTIVPGTVVKFVRIEPHGPANLYDKSKAKNVAFDRAELIVRGKLFARGTKDNMIHFTSAETSPKPGDWGAINFQDSSDNILEYCEVSYGNTAIHGHGVEATIQNCYLHDNGVSIGFKNVKEYPTKCSMSISNNRIIGNGGGVLCGKGTRSAISHNEISNNELYGIFGKKAFSCLVRYNNISRNGKGIILYSTKGCRLSENNIIDNKQYNVSMLEGQTWNVDARNNWWGTKDAGKIKNLIWDKDEEGHLGKVDFSDVASSPIQKAGVPG
jgi:parallel beta-helix repeat protein